MHPRGAPGPQHDPSALAFGVDSRADRFVISCGTPGGHSGRRAVKLVARHVRGVDPEEQADLTRDRREHVGRRDAAGDQRRHAPQRGLLVREPGKLLPARAVRDRRGDQLRELGEPILDVVEQGLALRDTGTHHAPELAVDDDRRAGA